MEKLKNKQRRALQLVYCQQPTQFVGPASSHNPLDGASERFTKGARNLFFLLLPARFTETEQPALWASQLKTKMKTKQINL